MRLLHRLAVGAAVGALVLTLSPSGPVQASSGASAGPRRFVTGWVPYWSPDSGLASVTNHAALFTDVSPFWFSTTGPGVVTTNGSSATLTTMVATLHAHGVAVIPTVTAGMDAGHFAALLSSRAARGAEVRALSHLAAEYGVDGIDLDFEQINFGSTKARDVVTQKFPAFAAQLHTALSASGRLLSLTLPARTSDTDPNWAVYDYGRLGAAADRVRIMTYDYHWGGGSPGPMAPRSWVRSVLSYAVTRITPSKVSFGLPSYGRDWYVKTLSGTCPAVARASTSLTSAQMKAYATSRGITPTWSRSGTSQTYQYVRRYSDGTHTCRVRRVAWYDDAHSVRAKVGLARAFGLRGVAFWALGYESPHMWQPLSQFGVRNAIQPGRLAATFPASLTYGAHATAVARLRAGSTAVVAAEVTLQAQRANGHWRDVATSTTNAHGLVRVAIHPDAATHYRFVAASAWARTAARTSPAQVRVRYAVGLTPPVARETVRRGASVHLSGSVLPSTAGLAVRLQVWNGRRWVHRAGTSTTASGAFTVAVSFASRGRHHVRVVVPTGSLDRGVSAPLVLRVS
jgi:spore germination protein